MHLGYGMKQTVGMNISTLMPAPHSFLHEHHLQHTDNKPTTSSCRSGAVVPMLSATGVQVGCSRRRPGCQVALAMCLLGSLLVPMLVVCTVDMQAVYSHAPTDAPS